MKLLAFVVLICISLEYVSLQRFSIYDKVVKNRTLEEQIQKLQSQVDIMLKYLELSQVMPKEAPKEIFLKSLPEKEKESLLCFKELYLIRRGQIDNGYNTRLFREEIDKNNGTLMIRSKIRIEFRRDFTKFSSQLTEDLADISLYFFDDIGICQTVGDMLDQLKLWGFQRFILNATYVEQKMNDFANEMSQKNYAFLREDYNECLEQFEIDLSQKLAPDTVSRIISLYRMIYGNRTEVETALSYLYGSRHYND